MYTNLSTQELLRKLEELGDQVPMELAQAVLAKDREAVLPLCDILQNNDYWEAEGNKQWMPLHAVKLLGMLADPSAIPQLVNTLILACEVDNDWIMEDLPTVFGHIGPSAILPLEKFIHAYDGDNELWWSRSTAVGGLVAIALCNPHEKEHVLSFLHALFSEEDDMEFLSFAALSLLDIGDPSSVTVLDEAFDRGLIDQFIIHRDDLTVDRARSFNRYDNDLLSFYNPEQVAIRQARWEKEKEEKEHHAAQKLEQREKYMSVELKRLEVVNALNKRNVLPINGKIGRNESCPCGSGKKFKKCCFSILKDVPPKQILGNGFYYNKWESLHKAEPYDTILILENLTFLAADAENHEGIVKALELFRILKPLAEQEGLLGKFLRNFGFFFSDHPELGEDGLDVLRQLQSFYEDKDREVWALVSVDVADYLNLTGKEDDCRNEYKKVMEMMPDQSLVRIRFARFLECGHYTDEAVTSYEHVLRMGDQIYEEDLKMAALELRELAARHNIELDVGIKETIDSVLIEW